MYIRVVLLNACEYAIVFSCIICVGASWRGRFVKGGNLCRFGSTIAALGALVWKMLSLPASWDVIQPDSAVFESLQVGALCLFVIGTFRVSDINLFLFLQLIQNVFCPLLKSRAINQVYGMPFSIIVLILAEIIFCQ